jgi:autophagy-related protein 9
VQLSRFVAFVSGALASVLALASVIDPELFLGFELTHDRTVLFYLGVFGSVWAVARGLVPEETDVFDPEFALLEVVDFTHYRPTHWTGKLHSDEVRREFASLYQMKIVIFLEEILSMIFTPFVLWFSLPKCSDRVIDFFREFTIHVDGLGYVCSFAVFNFKKAANIENQGRQQASEAPRDLRDDYFSTKDGKMLASYYGFLDSYGPNPRPGAAYAHPSTRRRFHPPPSFPTMGSALMTDTAHRLDRWDRQQIRHSPLSGPVMKHSRLGAMAPRELPGVHSPLPSMLLDPHHQPSAPDLRPLNRVNTSQHRQPRSSYASPINNNNQNNMEDLPEGANAVEGDPDLGRRRTGGSSIGGGAGTSESNLEGSWRMNLTDDVGDSEDGEEGDDVDAVVGNAGVLGLIHQFQKVSHESRAGRTTVGL